MHLNSRCQTSARVCVCVRDGWYHISASLEASAMINSTHFCLLPSVKERLRVGEHHQLSKTKSLKKMNFYCNRNKNESEMSLPSRWTSSHFKGSSCSTFHHGLVYTSILRSSKVGTCCSCTILLKLLQFSYSWK